MSTADTRSSGSRSRRWRWSTRELMILAALAVALGMALIPVQYAYLGLTAADPVFSRALTGLYAVPALVPMAMLRKPGAGLFAQLIAALVQVPLVPVGWLMLGFGLLFGVTYEALFAITRYRGTGAVALAAIGAVGVLAGLAGAWLPLALGDLTVAVQVGMVVGTAAGGVVAGLLSRGIVRGLTRAGVVISDPWTVAGDTTRDRPAGRTSGGADG